MMECVMHKNFNNTWSLTPAEGAFAGQEVAMAEGLNVAGVTFEGRTIRGIVKSAWGITLLRDLDCNTLQGIGLGQRFDNSACEPVWLDYDGYHDHQLRLLRGARRLMALSGKIATKGQFR